MILLKPQIKSTINWSAFGGHPGIKDMKDSKEKSAAEIKYRNAIERLDEILHQIENDDIDVDELSLQVKEAVNLVKMCKAKIDKAEMEVKQVVDDFAKAENQ